MELVKSIDVALGEPRGAGANITAAAHSIPFFLFISALPNELNEEKKRIDGHCRPLRIENEIILWNEIMEWTMKQRSCDWWKESLFFLNWWVMAAASGRGSANEREQTNFLWFMSNKVGELFLSERERAPIKSTKLICGGRSASQKETSPRELPFLFFSAGAQPKRKRKRTAR